MLERWYPTAHVPSVFAIDYEKLAALGYKGILFDIDNTLVHHGDDSTPEVDALFRHIHSLGLKTLLLSDNSAVRIERFNRNIRTLFIAEAGKPDPAAYRRACAILVDFIRLPGETHYGKKRVLEKVILWFYHRDPRRRGRLDGIGK